MGEESDRQMNERIINEAFARFRDHDRTDALRYAWEIPPVSEPMPQFVLQPTRNGMQIVQPAPSRERGPRLELTMVFTTGEMPDMNELADMLETIKDMIQETFASSVDSGQLEQVARSPYQARMNRPGDMY